MFSHSLDPKATFRFDAMNGWEARESGLWLKAQEAPTHEVASLRPASRGREPEAGS
jgi:hypothetical protein